MSLVLLTGAGGGIGRATALELGRRGASLALLGRQSQRQRELEDALSQAGVGFRSFVCDFTDAAALGATAKTVATEQGIPDAVIHNAGVIQRARIVDTTPISFDEQLAVNLRAPFMLTRALLPGMLKARKGRIVHVASISSTLGTAGAAAYGASKWGLVGFMKCLAEELKDTGLMTVAVLPGSVDTPMLKGSGFEPRIQPEDVARTLAHYALDAPLSHNGGVIEMFGT